MKSNICNLLKLIVALIVGGVLGKSLLTSGNPYYIIAFFIICCVVGIILSKISF